MFTTLKKKVINQIERAVDRSFARMIDGVEFKKIVRQCVGNELHSERKAIHWIVRKEIEKERKALHWIVKNELTKNASSLQIESLLDARKSSYEYAGQHLKDSRAFLDKVGLREYAVGRAEKEGMFLEFGVYQGESLRHIATLYPSNTVYGFDSFEGLPESWRVGFDHGHFKSDIPDKLPQNVELVVGFFEDTLQPFLEKNEDKVSFIHIDCDLYSSTKTIFQQIASRFQVGTVILFDEYFNYPDWQEGEYLAFHEMLATLNYGYKYIGYNVEQCQVAVILTENN